MSYFRKGDPLADFDRLDREQARYEASLPKCDNCGEPIHDDHCYKIHGERICIACLENEFREEIEQND